MVYKEDLTQTITNDIIVDMSNILSEEQLEKLKFVLYYNLANVKIENKGTEVALPINNDTLIKKYMASMMIQGLAKSTLERYKYVIDYFLRYVNKEFSEVETDDVKYFLAILKTQKKCTNTTVNGFKTCLNTFYSWLEKEEYILRNPVKKIDRIKEDTQPERELYGYELELLRQVCKNIKERAILEFTYSTACRVSEIVGIKLTDINFENKSCLVHGKGNKDRIVYFDDRTYVYLKEYLINRKDGCDCLFKSCRRNASMSIDGIENMFKVLGDRSGVKGVHPHRFRVTRITDLINHGMAIQNVQKLIGHENIETTERYFRSNSANIASEYFKYC